MGHTSVCHYRCFAADNRLSMDIYADSLANALRPSIDGNHSLSLSEFIPKSRLERYRENRFIMRYLRYQRYSKLVKQQNADIHHVLDHGYAHLLPNLNHGLKCITVHDLIPMLMWKGLIETDKVAAINRKPWLNLMSLSYLKKYDGIVAVSQNTRRDLAQQLNIDAQNITYIPPPIGEMFKPIADALVSQFADKYSLDQSSKWLMVSGSEFYKNHRGSLLAFKRLIENADIKVRLIKTGRPTADFNRLLKELDLEAHVTQLFLDNFNELPLLYNLVDCLLFPSWYEGFGMPVAEALACGTPVVTSNRGAIPEIVGSLTTGIDPNDIEALANAVLKTLTDANMVDYIATNGPNEMQRFSPKSVARMLHVFYGEL